MGSCHKSSTWLNGGSWRHATCLLQLISRLISHRTVFLSHNKSTISAFQPVYKSNGTDRRGREEVRATRTTMTVVGGGSKETVLEEASGYRTKVVHNWMPV